MTPAERIAQLEAVVEQQGEQIATLLERVHELEARLAKDTYKTKTAPGVRLYSADREGHRE